LYIPSRFINVWRLLPESNSVLSPPHAPFQKSHKQIAACNQEKDAGEWQQEGHPVCSRRAAKYYCGHNAVF